MESVWHKNVDDSTSMFIVFTIQNILQDLIKN